MGDAFSPAFCPRPAMALMRLEPYGMLILVGLIFFDPQIHVLPSVTKTLTNILSGTIFSTAVGLGTGTAP